MKTFIKLTIAAGFLLGFHAGSIASSFKSLEGPNDSIQKTDEISRIVVNRETPDTTKIRIGDNSYEVIQTNGKTYKHWKKEKSSKSFNSKLEAFYIGFNSFGKSDYSMYSQDKGFMDVKVSKSLEVGFYLFHGGLRLIGDHFGLVSGVGFSFNDYRFRNDYTIYKDQATGNIMPKFLDPVAYPNLDKTKLSVSYLNVPLLLQLEFPSGKKNFYLLGGVEGGVNLGSHTKVKYGDVKDKDHGDLDINPFKAAAIVRAGTSDLQFYAKYNMTRLFENGKGPELTPFSFGVCFVFD
ncbi:MAG: outer membrane beta-barrel protein [Bacteroidota bacterium]|nr:outer membrane beta-barrel protein [Bacteroidota bacterium]